MTHCDGYAADAVATDDHVAALGIDAEPDDALPSDVLTAVATPIERDRLVRLPTGRAPRWDRLLFSAKEAVYKTWFPLTRRWLGFGDVEIELHPTEHRFTARFVQHGLWVDGRLLTRLDGRWSCADGTLVTAVAVLRRPRVEGPADGAVEGSAVLRPDLLGGSPGP